MFQHYALSSYALTCALLRNGTPNFRNGAVAETGRVESGTQEIITIIIVITNYDISIIMVLV